MRRSWFRATPSTKPVAGVLLVLAAVAALVAPTASGPASGPAPAGEAPPGVERRVLTTTAGDREYLVAVPPGGGRGRPVVVFLHGCTQTAEEAAEATGFSAAGADHGFVVVFPEQDRRANLTRCWNWFSRAHQQRGAGEPAVIAGITRAVVAAEAADPRRLYVAGISAGGAMAVVMGVTWPDLYAAVGVVAGCPYRGLPCVGAPSVVPAEVSARAAYDAMGARARPVPGVVIHGDADPVVPPANGDLVVRQWLETADLADDGADNGSVALEPSERRRRAPPGGRAYEVARWAGPDGAARFVERWLVAGLGHAYPTGGRTGGDATDPDGPDATAALWAFFADHPAAG